MQVIYFLFALEKFQCLFELISVSFYLCNLCYASFCIAFAKRKWCKHLRDNRNTAFQHFKLHQISSRRSPCSKSNKWAVTISVYFFTEYLTWVFMGEKNKTCVTKTLLTNFTRCNCYLQVRKNLFIVLKVRSHAKLTSIFVNCNKNKKVFACCFPLRLFSRSLLSVVQS